jgi:hypothetical protein
MDEHQLQVMESFVEVVNGLAIPILGSGPPKETVSCADQKGL